MSSTDDVAKALIQATLEGGPADLPAGERWQRTAAASSKIKVLHRGAYEHFEPTGESRRDNDGEVRVFRWTMRTKIAE